MGQTLGEIMGIMICKTHGRVGFVETCQHVAQQIDSGKIPAGHRFTNLVDLLICDECYDRFGFEQFSDLAKLPPEESAKMDDSRWQAFEAAYEAVKGRRSHCLKCVAELEPKNSK